VPHFDLEPGLSAYTREPALARSVKAMGIRSYITVPLIAHDHMVGAMWLVTSDSKRVYDHEDLMLAQSVAARAAYPFYNLRRYGKTRQALRRCELEARTREHYVANLRHDVLSILTGVRLSAQMLQMQHRSRNDDPAMTRIFEQRIVDNVDRIVEILEQSRTVIPPVPEARPELRTVPARKKAK
jgi:hypothetical protein